MAAVWLRGRVLFDELEFDRRNDNARAAKRCKLRIRAKEQCGKYRVQALSLASEEVEYRLLQIFDIDRARGYNSLHRTLERNGENAIGRAPQEER